VRIIKASVTTWLFLHNQNFIVRAITIKAKFHTMMMFGSRAYATIAPTLRVKGAILYGCPSGLILKLCASHELLNNPCRFSTG